MAIEVGTPEPVGECRHSDQRSARAGPGGGRLETTLCWFGAGGQVPWRQMSDGYMWKVSSGRKATISIRKSKKMPKKINIFPRKGVATNSIYKPYCCKLSMLV